MVPGPQGGPAIASLLYGEYAPSGRLPITYPKDEGVTVPHWHRVTQACNGAAGGGQREAAQGSSEQRKRVRLCHEMIRRWFDH